MYWEWFVYQRGIFDRMIFVRMCVFERLPTLIAEAVVVFTLTSKLHVHNRITILAAFTFTKQNIM